MGARSKKHLAWILSISLLLGSGGSELIGDIISWAEVGVKEQGIVASDSQAYERTEIEGPEEGADEEARTDVEEREAETEIEIEIGKDEAGKDENSGDGTDKGEISRDEISKDETSQDRSDEDEADKDVEMGDEELYPYGYATKSDASVHPDHAVSEDKGDDIDVADLIDAEEDTYGYEHVTPDGIKILVKVTASDWPEDTQIQVVKVTGQEQERVTGLVEDALEKEAVSMVYAYDISFWSKGETFEPEGEIEVTFQFPEEEKERFKGKTEIFHVKDEEDHADIMQKESETEMEVSCLADGFSVYGVAVMSAGPIAIYTADELRAIDNDLSADYILMSDIDLSGWGEWEPIGNAANSQFYGNFDGNGHTISNLRLSVTGENGQSNVGLFGCVYFGSIKNLVITDAEISGTATEVDNIGILTGFCEASAISSCKVSGKIDITKEENRAVRRSVSVGGIVGYGQGSVEIFDCEGNASVTVNHKCKESIYVGGIISEIIGGNGILVERVLNRGDIKVISDNAGSVHIGGIAGNNTGKIRKCANYGMIDSDIAYQDKADTNLDSGPAHFVDIGGVQGGTSDDSSVVEESYNVGNISVNASGNSGVVVGIHIGGISGRTGNVTIVDNCYNIGQITCDATIKSPLTDKNKERVYIGSILGYQNDAGGKNCYYIQSKYSGIGHIGGNDVTAAVDPYVSLLNREMQRQDSFVGFDFGSTWKMGEGDYRYPILQWQDEGPDAPYIPDEDQPLTLISVTPPNNATGVKTTDRIVLEFNKGVYSKYGQDSTIYIKDYDTDEIIYKKTAGYGGVKTLFADNALIGCEAARCYIYIPENVFYAKVENEETGETTFEYFKGITDKDEYSFWMESDKLIYRATFDPMGGSEVGARSFQEGSQVKRPNDPIKDGYRFIGWFTDRECTQEFDFATLVYSDIILYAGWTGQDTSSGSGGSGSKVHHEKDTTDDRTASTNYSDDWHRNSNGDWICLDKDKKPLTGYQTGIYWNGIKGNWYFDEGGRMLTGWHEGKYFNENANGCQGAEITDKKILGFIQNGEASGTIGRYSYSLVFVNDIDEWTKVHSSIKNWSKEFQATVVGIWDTVTGKGNGLIQNIADAYMKDPAANKAFLSDIVNEMFSTKTWKQTSEMGGTLNDLVSMGGSSDTALNELWDAIENDEQSKIEADGWSEIKRVLNTFDEFQKMQMDYSRNIQYLESLKASVGPQSVLGKAVDDLIDGYKQQTARSFIKITENVLNGFGIDGTATSLMGLLTSDTVFLDIGKKMTDTLLSTSFGTADTLIQAAYTNASNVSAVDKVVYSTYLRSDAIMALRKAEERLASGNGGANAIEEYKNAFECARLMTLAQYKNMLKYYETSSYDKADKRSKIDYLRNEIDKLDVMTFIDYAGWGAETFYK